MHVIAAKAVAFKEALTPAFRDYQEQVLANARVLSRVLAEERGCASSRVVPNRTSFSSICGPRTSPARTPRPLSARRTSRSTRTRSRTIRRSPS
jgi:hypothetical protein